MVKVLRAAWVAVPSQESYEHKPSRRKTFYSSFSKRSRKVEEFILTSSWGVFPHQALL